MRKRNQLSVQMLAQDVRAHVGLSPISEKISPDAFHLFLKVSKRRDDMASPLGMRVGTNGIHTVRRVKTAVDCGDKNPVVRRRSYACQPIIPISVCDRDILRCEPWIKRTPRA